MDEKTISALKPITAIIALAIIESIALLQGIDGMMLSVIVALVAGLGGYTLGHKTSE